MSDSYEGDEASCFARLFLLRSGNSAPAPVVCAAGGSAGAAPTVQLSASRWGFRHDNRSPLDFGFALHLLCWCWPPISFCLSFRDQVIVFGVVRQLAIQRHLSAAYCQSLEPNVSGVRRRLEKKTTRRRTSQLVVAPRHLLPLAAVGPPIARHRSKRRLVTKQTGGRFLFDLGPFSLKK